MTLAEVDEIDVDDVRLIPVMDASTRLFKTSCIITRYLHRPK